MKKLLCLSLILCFYIISYGQRSTKKAVYPLKDLLITLDTLIIRGGPENNRPFKYDTLFKPDIQNLASQIFFNRNVKVEKYGVTPDGSISLYKNGKRIALMGCWKINKKEYGVNISINDQFIYHGLTISKEILDRLFINRHDQAP